MIYEEVPAPIGEKKKRIHPTHRRNREHTEGRRSVIWK